MGNDEEIFKPLSECNVYFDRPVYILMAIDYGGDVKCIEAYKNESRAEDARGILEAEGSEEYSCYYVDNCSMTMGGRE